MSLDYTAVAAGLAQGPMAAGDVLAVYGLLRPGGGAVERLGLTDALTFQGPAVIPGVLVDLGAYPGIVQGVGQVVGHLARLEAAPAGEILDTFEDFDPAFPDAGRYVRTRLDLVAPAGMRAWVYVWRGGPEDGRVITDGDWLAHVGSRPSGG